MHLNARLFHPCKGGVWLQRYIHLEELEATFGDCTSSVMVLGGGLLGFRAITAFAFISHRARNPPHDHTKLLGSSGGRSSLKRRQYAVAAFHLSIVVTAAEPKSSNSVPDGRCLGSTVIHSYLEQRSSFHQWRNMSSTNSDFQNSVSERFIRFLGEQVMSSLL